MNKYEAAEKFIHWLENQILLAGRGDKLTKIAVEPSGKFWYGRIAPQDMVMALNMGDRGERLEPCAIGVKIRPLKKGPWKFKVGISLVAWLEDEEGWVKTKPYSQIFDVEFSEVQKNAALFREDIRKGLFDITGIDGLSAEIIIEKQIHDEREELLIQLVNTSPAEHPDLSDTRLYETVMDVKELALEPFYLAALPDSFRYDREIWAYGINAGIEKLESNHIRTIDAITAPIMRPVFWPEGYSQLDLKFESLATNPLEICNNLLTILKQWGQENWSDDGLNIIAKADEWNKEMLLEAKGEAGKFFEECARLESGVKLLREDPELLQAFSLMNKAMKLSAQGKYEGWRPFQLGFLLSNLATIKGSKDEKEVVDIVWFATGGGKTETYLGLIVTAALYDRMRGKISGITAWSRFPLRMLSLQQTQRFADAMGAAEIIRTEAKLVGDPFSMGFFVGQSSTPNAIDPEPEENAAWDPDDSQMPNRLQVLERCPFCHDSNIEMAFNRKVWKLEHRCKNSACFWQDGALPFYLVDEEIYRFLPTVIVGTLDKAASIAMQASMRGFVGAPLGMCPRPGHGYTYAKRSKHPTGCLVPGCKEPIGTLPQKTDLYGLSFRLQDELHLLRDSLGAVDAHYEAALDGLQKELTGEQPKIIASSATLAGYEKQADVIYRRRARVFPQPGPKANRGFWRSASKELMRNYVAIAPRGVTIEWTVDRLLTEIQRNIRKLNVSPKEVCSEAGIPIEHADFIVSIYGTNVVYGNTLRDIDAAVRSMETQVDVEGIVNTASLTGRTGFDEVRQILRRLENFETKFEDRLHLLSASSMMSHGVDVDRLNVMVMLGLPLSTAEFIQATARVGRKWPGLVFVIHKIGRERDASVFKSFRKFVEQGDRLLEPIPVTRRSRRVLERTIAGIEQSRLYHIHESKSSFSLTTVKSLKQYLSTGALSIEEETKAIKMYLRLQEAGDENLIEDIKQWFDAFFKNIQNPPPEAKFMSDISPTGPPMRSLRDVEEQAPVIGSIYT